MTLVEAETRVRHLANQISTTNTLFDNTNFIDHVLNQGRRMFASILPEQKLPKLRKSATLAIASFIGTYPSDFLRPMEMPNVLINVGAGLVKARRIESWRLNITNALLDNIYFYERSDGIVETTGTMTACTYEYIKTPAALSGTTADSTDLPIDVEDLVIDFAFKKCMGTTRGNLELATFLAREQGMIIGAKQ